MIFPFQHLLVLLDLISGINCCTNKVRHYPQSNLDFKPPPNPPDTTVHQRPSRRRESDYVVSSSNESLFPVNVRFGVGNPGPHTDSGYSAAVAVSGSLWRQALAL